MRKLILQLAVSLDGYIEGPNGEFDWCFTTDDYGMSAFFKRIDSVFYGRKTYELVVSMESEAPPGFQKLKEYVFSNSFESVRKGTVLIKDDIKNQVEKIKKK